MITVSIVSHGHGLMVTNLIEQLRCFPSIRQIILIRNIPEPFNINADDLLLIITNPLPIGFGENHNNAFKICSQPYFCVLNPDILFTEDPFPVLLKCLKINNIASLAPIIISRSGKIEDSARFYPDAVSLLRKLFFFENGRWPLDLNKALNYPDWVAGMFMLFPYYLYKEIGGFDERYFLYYEDVDICRRIRSKGYQIALCTQVKVIHNAQRTSRNNIKFMFWHLKSLFRFLFLNTK